MKSNKLFRVLSIVMMGTIMLMAATPSYGQGRQL